MWMYAPSFGGLTHKWDNVERSDRTRGVSHLYQQLWAGGGSREAAFLGSWPRMLSMHPIYLTFASLNNSV